MPFALRHQGPQDTCILVRHCDTGPIGPAAALNLDDPTAPAVLFSRSACDNGACSMNQQRAEVSVPPLADAE